MPYTCCRSVHQFKCHIKITKATGQPAGCRHNMSAFLFLKQLGVFGEHLDLKVLTRALLYFASHLNKLGRETGYSQCPVSGLPAWPSWLAQTVCLANAAAVFPVSEPAHSGRSQISGPAWSYTMLCSHTSRFSLWDVQPIKAQSSTPHYPTTRKKRNRNNSGLICNNHHICRCKLIHTHL